MTKPLMTFQSRDQNILQVQHQPRAEGDVRVAVKSTALGSAIDQLSQTGSLRALFPRRAYPPLEMIVINTAGGVTGGDSFRLGASLAQDTELTITTQAAERAYRALVGEIGRIENRVEVASGARLNWLPQETILFDRCNVERRLIIDLAPGAELLLVEPLVFGRRAMGERLACCRFRDRITVLRAGRPLFLDGVTLTGDVAGHLQDPAVAGGAGAMATIVLAAPSADIRLAEVRALLPRSAGASCPASDLLVCRILAEDAFDLRATLIPLLATLGGRALPRSWMI
jgi:urease accessory protein